MKLNNKGFAISTMMYLILIMAVLLIIITLTLLGNRKVILDKIKTTTQDEIYAEADFTKLCKAVDSKTQTTGNIPVGYFKPGDEYICKVNASQKFHFFLLKDNNNGTINLILDRNIYYNPTTGLSVLSTNTNGNIEWYNEAKTEFGPATAMLYVYNATKNWSNISNIEIDYTDPQSQYGKIETTGIRTAITKLDKEEANVFNNLKARLPMYSELSQVGCSTSQGSCPLWISNYLHKSDKVTGGTNISNVFGYWLLDSIDITKAWGIGYNGNFDNFSDYSTVSNVYRGVRPVITIRKSDIEGNNESVKYCKPVTTSSDGLVPTGQYKPGDEYICKVSSNQNYNFYVLNKNGDDITLISKENIYYDSVNEITNISDSVNLGYTKWSDDTSKGPITVFEYLYNATKNWDNVRDLKVNILDENMNASDMKEGLHNTGYGKLLTVEEKTYIYKRPVDKKYITTTASFDNIKARLPMMYELTDNGCKSTANTCPLWLAGTRYYWTSSTVNESSTNAYAITNRNYTSVAATNTQVGIRPVIVLSKSNFAN